MSHYEDSFELQCPPEKAKQICGQAITSSGLAIDRDLGYGFACSQRFQVDLMRRPVTVNVVINQKSATASLINISGSNFGLGAITSNQVRDCVLSLRRAIEELIQPSKGAKPGSGGPAAGREVIVNGVPLRDDQLNFLEGRYPTRIPDGAYWYDKLSGAWGMQGGPVLSTIEAGFDLGGPLQANASNGNTGVFINGRELHLMDVMLLQQVVSVIMPGRWWLDAYGNFGAEGGPMLGNLWTIAQSYTGAGTGGSRGSVLSTWDRTGVAVFSG